MPTLKMLTTITRILVLSCCFGLGACATITTLSIPNQPSEEYIAGLLENHQFDIALQAIDKWQASHPNDLNLPKQRTKITQAISLFESDMLKKAKQLDDKGQWQEAKNVYESAIKKLPSSQSLQNAYSDFSVRRLKHINALKEDLDVAKAKHFLSIKEDIEAIYNTAPNDYEARNWKEKSDSEREALARRLVDYGLEHEKNNHFGTAALRYDLAYRLSPSEFTKPYHERAAKTFAQRKAKQSKRAKKNQQRQQSKLSKLIPEFDSYLAKEDFRLAKQTLVAMEAINAKSPEVRTRRKKLEKQRNIALDKAILKGKKFYTKGEFENAIDVWQRALQLDPDNKEVKENIQRAEKFRDNIERLKQGS